MVSASTTLKAFLREQSFLFLSDLLSRCNGDAPLTCKEAGISLATLYRILGPLKKRTAVAKLAIKPISPLDPKRDTMTLLRIFGIEANGSSKALWQCERSVLADILSQAHASYRRNAKKVHPDNGGDINHAVEWNLTWGLLEKRFAARGIVLGE